MLFFPLPLYKPLYFVKSTILATYLFVWQLSAKSKAKPHKRKSGFMFKTGFTLIVSYSCQSVIRYSTKLKFLFTDLSSEYRSYICECEIKIQLTIFNFAVLAKAVNLFWNEKLFWNREFNKITFWKRSFQKKSKGHIKLKIRWNRNLQ